LGARIEAAYFNCDEIEEKVVLSFVPRLFTTLMIATEMLAAIRPYSIAVAPDSSAKNWRHFAIMATVVSARRVNLGKVDLPKDLVDWSRKKEPRLIVSMQPEF
jgi:hypothetical protein